MIRSLRLPAASALAVLMSIVVSACSSSATASPTPAPTVPGLGSGLTLPSGSGGLGGLLGGLLGGNNNPGLQAKLPAQVCGAPALTFSMPAGVIPASALSGLAGGAGSILSGISSTETFALAFAGPGPAASDPCDVTYFAVQISGGDANSFVQLVLQQNQADGGSSTTTSLGGKNVTVVTDSSGDKTYFTVNGDTAVGVQAPDDATAAAAFTALP
jgi:hypothetical protein